MKILQLSPRFPFPMDDGGKIGIGNILIEFFRQGCEVSFFTFINEEVSGNSVEELKKYSNPLLLEHSTKNTIPRIIKSIFTNKSIYIQKHSERKVLRYFDEIIEKNDFDVIHTDHTAMAPIALYLKKMTHKPIGIRLHNIEFMIWKRYAEILPKNHPKRIYIQHQAELLKRFESRIYSEFDVCFPITEVDKKLALELSPDSKQVVSGPGIDDTFWVPDETVERNPNELIIATVFSWKHNLDGLLWFKKNVLPIVRKQNPNIKLSLIGKDIPDFLRNYESEGVNVIGYVDDVRPYLNKAGIYIVPLFVGSGIRIKIIEAMAMKLPVLATSIAAEGINAKAENGLIICNDANEFSENILQLSKNLNMIKDLGENARKFSLSNFSWKSNVIIMIENYKKLAKLI
ncbi:MAG: glycosyltransferase [Candidatus Kapabacteria bacterium]|nr:glycosyltransferase [Candidatus Kapabacteria bacterium]